MKNFGQMVREERLKKRLTLREFCRKASFDPSYWSRIERGLAQPPKTKVAMLQIADALGLESVSEEYLSLKDIAFLENSPTELAPERSVYDNLPAFFKTARGQAPSEDELRKLFELIKSESDGKE